jgi:hypothetical protein
MEMAKYIMTILKTQIMIIWSWGFHKPMAVKNGLRFNVQGFKFRGVVEVVYNEAWDLFDVSFIKGDKVINTIEGVYFDMLVDTIDYYVEKTADYEKRVKEECEIKVY